jgi:hypothetical protein
VDEKNLKRQTDKQTNRQNECGRKESKETNRQNECRRKESKEKVEKISPKRVS